MSLDPEYIKYFNKYHTDRISSLTDTHDLKCKNCNSSIIKFIVSDNQLIYSCGGNNDCGHQFTITLPVYIEYHSEKLRLINLYQETNDDKYKKELDDLDKLYNKENNLSQMKKIYDDMKQLQIKHYEKNSTEKNIRE